MSAICLHRPLRHSTLVDIERRELQTQGQARQEGLSAKANLEASGQLNYTVLVQRSWGVNIAIAALTKS